MWWSWHACTWSAHVCAAGRAMHTCYNYACAHACYIVHDTRQPARHLKGASTVHVGTCGPLTDCVDDCTHGQCAIIAGRPLGNRTVQHPTAADHASFQGPWLDKADGFAEYIGSAELHWHRSTTGKEDFMDIRHTIKMPARTPPLAQNNSVRGQYPANAVVMAQITRVCMMQRFQLLW